MPIFVIVIVLLIALVIGVLCLVEEIWLVASISATIVIALVLWMALAANVSPEILSDEIHLTRTLENEGDGSSISILVIEGKVINITEELERSFPSGTKIRRVIKSRYSGGINWAGPGLPRKTDPGWKQGAVEYLVAGKDTIEQKHGR